MQPKYTVEYTVQVGKHSPALRYDSDAPVDFTEFLVALLERGLPITALLHDGVPLEPKQADHFVKQAASMLAARHVCASLRIDGAEEHYRFGFAA